MLVPSRVSAFHASFSVVKKLAFSTTNICSLVLNFFNIVLHCLFTLFVVTFVHIIKKEVEFIK